MESVAAGRPCYSHYVHRDEDGIHADESDGEMNLAQRLAHHLSEHLREPEVCPGKHREYRRYSHNQVEVADDEVSIVELNIKRRLSEQESRDAARHEQRNEP